jgi:hypothetical protein
MQNDSNTLAKANKYLRIVALRHRILKHNAATTARIEGMNFAFASAEKFAFLLRSSSEATKSETHRL